eukprot:CAMPEP_0202961422 /NCGR_PEP_ID=MMETSP1396-20130829/5473_1 /ASSEMBLY_ACC=CAM_ASM_000872 /TAXON_ID= /ORGANISM="Pseudokeronopsis sp., Strain Brazil" /LENGTH=61 /DNA_ID=CAMNT_0049681221 /DNA_START=646 /DNA_END=831 /DNA_ORIENTATION=-
MLFKKYNDKDNKEMNFKKLLLTKCQKQFYKMKEATRNEGDKVQALEGEFYKEVNQESDFNK